jgi:hypothetical protein
VQAFLLILHLFFALFFSLNPLISFLIRLSAFFSKLYLGVETMDVRIINCIRQYIKEKYVGGVIKISDIARYCQISEGRVIKGLVELEYKSSKRLKT